MFFIIDIGNTNIVVALVENDNITKKIRISTDKSKTQDEYLFIIKNYINHFDIDVSKITGTVISSVVPNLNNSITNAFRSITNTECLIIDLDMCKDIKIDLQYPETLAGDILASIVYSLDKFSPPFAIIDMGTATTIGVVDENSSFIGGMIIPGVVSSLNSLISNSSMLPDIDLNNKANLIGNTTVDCMLSGSLIAQAAMIDGIKSRLNNKFSKEIIMIATGGLSNVIIPYCESNILLDDDLVLKGLKLMYETYIRKKK